MSKHKYLVILSVLMIIIGCKGDPTKKDTPAKKDYSSFDDAVVDLLNKLDSRIASTPGKVDKIVAINAESPGWT